MRSTSPEFSAHLSDFASAIRLRHLQIHRILVHSAGIPLLSHLSDDPSTRSWPVKTQNDLMSDPSADRWANILRSRMRTSCTCLDQGSIGHADRFFLAGTWFDHNHPGYINCMASWYLHSPELASCSTAITTHDIGVGILWNMASTVG